jgi:hypothetical protein
MNNKTVTRVQASRLELRRSPIRKRSGWSASLTAYAVMSFGGFLGMGEEYFPMPWASLKYDTGLEGYRVNMTEDQLRGAPRFNRSTDWDWSDRSKDRTIPGARLRRFHPRLWQSLQACTLR